MININIKALIHKSIIIIAALIFFRIYHILNEKKHTKKERDRSERQRKESDRKRVKEWEREGEREREKRKRERKREEKIDKFYRIIKNPKCRVIFSSTYVFN